MKIKKIISTVLAAAISVSVGADAQTSGTPGGMVVDVQIRNTGGFDIVYYVDLEWSSDFIYEYDRGVWDPETHTYDPPYGSFSLKNGGGNSADIKVTNHSNVPVNVEFGFVQYKGSFTAAAFTAEDSTEPSGTLFIPLEAAQPESSAAEADSVTVNFELLTTEESPRITTTLTGQSRTEIGGIQFTLHAADSETL